MLDMLNLTQKSASALLLVLLGCQNQQDKDQYQEALRQQIDKASEARIDSAYSAIQRRCDSLLMYRVPQLADSMVKAMDSTDHLQTITHGK
jgi:uncharacterized lipoprotein NlpE involved in copper resistance